MKANVLASLALAFSTAIAAPYPIENGANDIVMADNEQVVKRNGDSMAIPNAANAPSAWGGKAIPPMKRGFDVVSLRRKFDEGTATKRDETMPSTFNKEQGPGFKREEHIANAPARMNNKDILASKRDENVPRAPARMNDEVESATMSEGHEEAS